MRQRDVAGTVYLVHFDHPYRHARHYLGTNNLELGLARHRCGDGAGLMAIITDSQVTWELARTWNGTRSTERRLKNRGGHARLCPLYRSKAQP